MNRFAIYAVIICAFIGGFSGIIIKYMSMTAGAIVWLRTVIPAFIFGVWIVRSRSLFIKCNSRKMIIASFINACRMYLFILAFQHTTISNVMILFYSWPIFVNILSVFFFKERMSKKQLLFLMMAFVGLIILSSNRTIDHKNKGDYIGVLAALCSAIGYAVNVMIFKSEMNNYTKHEIIFYQNIMSALIFLPFFIIDFPNLTGYDMGWGTLLGILVGTIAVSLFFYGLRYLKASVTSSIMYIEVLSGTILGYFFFKDTLNANMVIGGILIVLSSFYIMRESKKNVDI
ncbi:DMT family transporter [Aquimarina megaterium]|uniref:DMT family transporter n=1 Tax=Aquimarina megaterium TaxID=1443666 RepID=UPI000943B7EA|nr:EamA family transporter [Aquimarina megaterium]